MGAIATEARWSILGDLASGGMARVQVARFVSDDGAVRTIAVKRLHRHLAIEERFIRMFLDEAWMTAGLKHPNVVELVGWGEDDEGDFLALELVRGAPLAQVARSGRAQGKPMPSALIAYVGARIADGLAAAHAGTAPDGTPLCLVHRDLTPRTSCSGSTVP